jgi:hypothetical protein
MFLVVQEDGVPNIGAQFYACSDEGLPQRLSLNSGRYRLRSVLKHDFFAATALYEYVDGGGSQNSVPRKVILKLSRQGRFLAVPTSWLGRFLCRHELSVYRELDGLAGVPKILSLYADIGFVYEYVEGCSLDEQPQLPDDFFDSLHSLVKQVHSRDVAYVDMNKRGNIISGSDSRPYLIDFQISLHLPGRLCACLRNALQCADIYHLFKHKRKICPRLLTSEERILSYHKGFLISLHRCFANPYKKLRRAMFRYLYQKGVLAIESGGRFSRENDNARFFKQ